MHQSQKTAYESQHCLTSTEEEAVKAWADHCAMQGHPFDLKELHAYATEISGKTLGKNWPQKYAASSMREELQ